MKKPNLFRTDDSIGSIVIIEGISYLAMYDGRIFKFVDSLVKPTILLLNKAEKDKLSVLLLEKKLEK